MHHIDAYICCGRKDAVVLLGLTFQNMVSYDIDETSPSARIQDIVPYCVGLVSSAEIVLPTKLRVVRVA